MDVDSPEKFEETLTIFPDLSPGGSETWSTGANYFPLNCASTPNYEENSQRYIFDTQLSIPYSPGALGEILEEPGSLFVPKEIVRGLVDSTLESSFNASSLIPANMEEEQFNKKLKDLKFLILKVQLRIDDFTPDHVTLFHKDSLPSKLEWIK